MPKTTILVTDVHQIGGLGVVRSLGAAGYLVFGAAPSKWLSVGGCRSRFLHELLVSPSPWASPAEYSDWIVSTCKQRQFDLVLPTSEASLIAADDAVHRGALHSSSIVAPSHVSLYRCLDYEAVVAALARSGIQVPHTVLLCDGTAGPTNAVDEVEIPLRVHRPLTLTPRGRLLGASDRLVKSRDELLAFADESASLSASLIGLEPGQSPVASVLCSRWNGEPISEFAQRSIHTVNNGRAWSALRETLSNPALEMTARQIVHTIDLDGLCNVQFRRGSDGGLVFDSITPGCPSSLALALYRGNPLPTLLVDRILGRSNRRLRPSAHVTRCGNLYPGEIGYLALLRKNAQGSRQVSLLDGILAVVKNQIDPRVGRDYFWWSDPRPGLAQLRTLFRKACMAVVRHLRQDDRHRRPLQYLSKHSQLPRTPIRNVLFLCRGNICRSYLAAERFSSLIARTSLAIEIRSAGIDTAGGYRPPEKFRRLFERFGLSIDEHRSRALNVRDLAWADLVVVMDQQNVTSLRRRGIEIDKRFYLLGVFGNHDEIEIADPVGAKPHEAVGIMVRVDYCVARLAEVVQSVNPK